MILKKIIKLIVEKLGYRIVTRNNFEKAQAYQSLGMEFEYLLQYSPMLTMKYLIYKSKSKSQLGQDLFCLLQNGFKEDGYFVEFGATNGVSLSNSYLLENSFKWKGILAEPSFKCHKELKENRKVHIERDCLWSITGETLMFNETIKGSLSTLDVFSDTDNHSVNRVQGKKYEVKTISLFDMLQKYEAPSHIDFLSIDTEGSEHEILSNFDFNTYTFNSIVVEHNYMPIREKIFQLLTSHGYKRVHKEYSRFDDWYTQET